MTRERTGSGLLCTGSFLDILTQFSLILILINRTSRLMIRSSPNRRWVIFVIALISSKAVSRLVTVLRGMEIVCSHVGHLDSSPVSDGLLEMSCIGGRRVLMTTVTVTGIVRRRSATLGNSVINRYDYTELLRCVSCHRVE